MDSLAAVLKAPWDLQLEVFEVPRPDEDSMVLRVEMVSVCGTDVSMFAGKLAGTPYPLIMGHELVGFVHWVGERAAAAWGVGPGDRVVVEPYISCRRCVACWRGDYHLCEQRKCYGFTISCKEPPHLWGAYSQFMFVAPGSRVHKVASQVRAEAACLSSVLGNGIRWVRERGRLRIGDVVVIMGPGPQGLCTVLAARAAGAGWVVVVGLPQDRSRLELALRLGADQVYDSGDWRVSWNRKADLVIDCTGKPGVVESGLAALRPGGRYVVVGLGGGVLALDYDYVVRNEIEVVGGIGQAWAVEDALRLIERGCPLDALVTHVFELEECNDLLARLAAGNTSVIKAALRPS